MKNRYIARTRISEAKFRQIWGLFRLNIKAIKAQIKQSTKPYAQVVKNHAIAKIPAISQRKTNCKIDFCNGGLKTDDSVTCFGYKRLYHTQHSVNEFANKRNHVNVYGSLSTCINQNGPIRLSYI